MTNERNSTQDWGSVDEETSRKYVNGIRGIEITKENKWFYIIIAISLGSTTIIALGGAIALSYIGKEVPSALVAIGSVAVGALGGIFSKNT